jgi:transcriptional regulator with XRE-family HTH domain
MGQAPRELTPLASALDYFGAQLRQWRIMRKLSQVALGQRTHDSGALISKVEKGERFPSRELARRMDAALDTGGALERLWPQLEHERATRYSAVTALGFVNARARRGVAKLEDVYRKQFIHAVTGLGVGLLLQDGLLAALLHGGSEPIPIPRRIGVRDIEQIRTATRVFESWIHTYGGESARGAIMGQLRWSAQLQRATCPAPLRPELFSALGDLAETAGFMAVDAGAHEEARCVFGFALICAEKANDWPLRAEVLSSMAEHAIWTGRPDYGLALAEHALLRADRLTATGQALLHNDRARALAKMRRINEALTAIGTADDHFAHASPANDPPCMAFYDTARHAQLTGLPLCDLAMLGHNPGAATHRLESAAAGHAANNSLSRAICLTKLATLTMATGDPLHAATIGHTALDTAPLCSRRTAEELRELARHATAHQHINEVAHLRQRINTLLMQPDTP